MNVSVTPPSVPQPLGQHVIAEFYGATALTDGQPAEAVLRKAAVAAGAVVLEVRQHDFGARAGFTGFAVLAESHISIHTWPEHGYAAIDIFMCGDADTAKSLEVLRAYFKPTSENVQTLTRGCPTALSQVMSLPQVAV